MKHYIRITILAAVLFLAGAVILIASLRRKNVQDISRENIIILNDIAYTAEAHRSDLYILNSHGYGVDFVILDNNDNVICSQTADDITCEKLSVETAIQKRYPYRYLTDISGVWGCVILLDDGTKEAVTLAAWSASEFTSEKI